MSTRKYKNPLKKLSNGSSSNNKAGSTELTSLSEMFPDWGTEDLTSLLNENNNDLEVVIDLIVSGKVSKWEPIKKEPKKKKDDDTNAQSQFQSASQSTTSKGTPAKTSRPKPVAPKKQPAKKPVKKTVPSTAKIDKPADVAPADVAAELDGTASSWAAALSQEKKKPEPKREVEELVVEQEPEPVKATEPIETTVPQPVKEKPAKKAAVAAATAAAAAAPPSSSWASMVAPKPKVKPQPKPKATKAENKQVKSDEAAPVPAPQAVSEEQTANDLDIPIEEIKNSIPKVPEVSEEPAVILPTNNVGNVGVTFGSLSLEENKDNVPAAVPVSAPAPVQEQGQANEHKPTSTEATRQSTEEERYNQYYYQQSQKSQFDYYNQFPQQQNQQFQQQVQQSQQIPGQYAGYPVDYNYSQMFAAQQLALQQQMQQQQQSQQSQSSQSQNGDSNHSPVNVNQQAASQFYQPGPVPQIPGQQVAPVDGQQPQQPGLPNQQVPPYGYPYYNYYYNQPFYQQGLAQNGFNSPSIGNVTPQAPGLAPQTAQAAQGGQPGQPGQAPGQPNPNSNSNQPIVPPFGGYQQYPQYGYQDNSQYRGWY